MRTTSTDVAHSTACLTAEHAELAAPSFFSLYFMGLPGLSAVPADVTNDDTHEVQRNNVSLVSAILAVSAVEQALLTLLQATQSRLVASK